MMMQIGDGCLIQLGRGQFTVIAQHELRHKRIQFPNR